MLEQRLQGATERSGADAAKDLILTGEQYRAHPFAQAEERAYIFVIQKGNKQLSYFGSSHSNDPEDPQFDEIDKAFARAKPQIVLVEGMESINERKDKIREMGKTVSLEGAIRRGGESFYALKLALDSGVDFESPEPRLDQEIQALLSAGYSKKSIFDFYAYRGIFQYQREAEEKTVEGLKEYLMPRLENFRTHSGWPKEEIDAFTEELFSSEIDLNSPKYEKETDPIPWDENEQTVTNKISQASSRFRDRYMVGRIAELLKKYDRIFVVYGSGHAVKQEPAIRALFS